MTKLLNYTQRAGQYIGQIDDEQQQSTKKTPTGIHLLDSNERIIGVLTNQSDKIYWDTKITEDQQDNLLTFDFTTLGTIDFTNVRFITAQDQDGNHRLFVLSDIEKVHDENGLIQIIHADGDHVSLAQDQPIAPTTLSGATAETAAQFVLTNSRYKLGQVDFLGSREVKFTDFLSPLAALNRIASDFDAVLRFRVEIIGNTIQRYVDILEPIDIFSGKEFVFGKDIIGLKRKENRADIVTRLVGYGPADEDGNFVTFESINDGKNYVEDADAFQRWNDGGRHRYGIFQYQPEDTTDVTPQKVLDATKDALKRQNDAVVEYELTGAALEQIMGYEHEKVRVGMTIRIKDTYFEPALYLEAKVLRTEMPEYGDPNGEFKYEFGNYQEAQVSIPDAVRDIQSKLFRKEVRWTVAKDLADAAQQTATNAQNAADTAQQAAETAQQSADSAQQTAQAAQASADAATQMAQNAQISADGKNTVFHQSTQPSTEGRKVGDLWFDTGNGNRMYVWTDNAWTLTQLDYQALSVGQLSAISADLGNITAGNITGVTMNLAGGKFVVDADGNVTFGGTLSGATGEFAGELTSSMVVIGPEEPSIPYYENGHNGLALKMVQRISDGVYQWMGRVAFKVGNGEFQVVGERLDGLEQSGILNTIIFKALLQVDDLMINNTLQTLWTGAAFMTDTQTITPSKPLSACTFGWVLVWSNYTTQANNWNFVYHFIPKSLAGQHTLFMVPTSEANANSFTTKALSITNTTLTGVANNSTGINAQSAVLRQVLGM